MAYEHETLWDALGILLVIAAITSFLLVFAGVNPVVDAFTTEVVTVHLVAIGVGVALAEGGIRSLVENLVDALT